MRHFGGPAGNRPRFPQGPPWRGGTPGGHGARRPRRARARCTFRRVFNNSPSRDKMGHPDFRDFGPFWGVPPLGVIYYGEIGYIRGTRRGPKIAPPGKPEKPENPDFGNFGARGGARRGARGAAGGAPGGPPGGAKSGQKGGQIGFPGKPLSFEKFSKRGVFGPLWVTPRCG